MVTDRYARTAAGWATAASRVYRPLATDLAAHAPHPLAGRLVLDAGAGTGAGTAALLDVGARPLALDLSEPMLGWDAGHRPPAVVADVTRIPLRDKAVDDCLAAFVLNHLPEPVAGLAELARVTTAGGAVLVSVFDAMSSSAARDLVDDVAVRHGFVVPDWYLQMKVTFAPLLGSVAAMGGSATRAGLRVLDVDSGEADVGVTTAPELVDYRLGQAQYTDWVAGLTHAQRLGLWADAVETVGDMPPYRPVVVRLVALAPR